MSPSGIARVWVFAAFAVVACVACSDLPPSACAPLTRAACTCDDGRQGVRGCMDEGTWGPCVLCGHAGPLLGEGGSLTSGDGGAGAVSATGGSAGSANGGASSGETPESCADAVARFGVTSDAIVRVHPPSFGATPAISVFCAGISDGIGPPSEYLDLQHNTELGFANANYSSFAGSSACACAAARIDFTRARVDLSLLQIVVEDRRFASGVLDASCTASSACPFDALGYGTAGSSVDGGSASIDLTGTPFVISPRATFNAAGPANGTVSISVDRLTAVVTAQGLGGFYGPALSGDATALTGRLQLAWR